MNRLMSLNFVLFVHSAVAQVIEMLPCVSEGLAYFICLIPWLLMAW